MGGVYPLSGSQYKAVESGFVFKPLEFEGFKISVIQPLPYTQIFNGIAVSHPVLDDMIRPIRLFVLRNVRQGNIVINSLGENSDGSSLNFDAGFSGLAHVGFSYAANWFKET